MTETTCRLCETPLAHEFVDLGKSPLSNSFLRADELQQAEPFYPLQPLICHKCLLVQLPELAKAEGIFSDYAYFSSYSTTWLRHSEEYAQAAIDRFALGPESRVVEIASNDGYLLQHFMARDIRVLGIEPARNVAQAAIAKGVPTAVEFFGMETVDELTMAGKADLIVANNVLAHVPDLHDFVAATKALLKPGGVVTMEFSHLMRMIQGREFDSIYHEHFSYFTLATVTRLFQSHGLAIFDVDELPTHGGSLRIYARHAGEVAPQEDSSSSQRLAAVARQEEQAGLTRLEGHLAFGESVRSAKREILDFLIAAKRDGKRVVAYGAPAKGNTLLNFCGIGRDFIDYAVDINPYKQGLYLPGTQIPIRPPAAVAETRPDLLLILAWNLRDEIMEQMSSIREWGARFVVPLPEVAVYE